LWAAGVAGAVLAIATGPVSAQTMTDALATAYTTNPDLASQRELLRSTIEGVPQALGNWRPTVSLNLNTARNFNEANSRSSSGGINSSREQFRSPHEGTLTITQPLFRGFRTTAGVAVAEDNVKKGVADLDAKEESVLLAAATAYMNVVRDQATLQLNINSEQVFARQLQATRDRFDVGEVTRTDVSQAESALAGATASRITAEGALESSRAVYRSVVGGDAGGLTPPPAPDVPPDLQTTINAAKTKHPSVLSASYAEKSALENVRLVEGELLPTLNFVGSLDKTIDGSARLANDERTMTETALAKLDLTIPIYEQGAVYARARAAKLLAGKARIDLDSIRSSRISIANQAWESLRATRAKIASIQSQIDAAQIALEGVQREAQVGSRTTLDILTAEQTLLNAQVSLVSAQRDEIVAAYQVKEAVGELTAANLQLPVNVYDPKQYYNQARDKFIGLGVPNLPEPSSTSE
jgi:outer membrane protein